MRHMVRRSVRRPMVRVAGAFGVIVALALTACGGSPTGGTASGATPTVTAAPTATPTTAPAATATAGGYAVKVYFSKHPTSDNDPTAVFSVGRVSPTLGVATYSIGQLFTGPSSSEQAAGYYSPWTGQISGASNCGGADFKIILDHRGATPAPGVATLQLCRTVSIPGELAGPRMTSTAEATLKQFSNIHSVVILTKDGGCFDDLSGQNKCLSS